MAFFNRLQLSPRRQVLFNTGVFCVHTQVRRSCSLKPMREDWTQIKAELGFNTLCILSYVHKQQVPGY